MGHQKKTYCIVPVSQFINSAGFEWENQAIQCLLLKIETYALRLHIKSCYGSNGFRSESTQRRILQIWSLVIWGETATAKFRKKCCHCMHNYTFSCHKKQQKKWLPISMEEAARDSNSCICVSLASHSFCVQYRDECFQFLIQRLLQQLKSTH